MLRPRWFAASLALCVAACGGGGATNEPDTGTSRPDVAGDTVPTPGPDVTGVDAAPDVPVTPDVAPPEDVQTNPGVDAAADARTDAGTGADVRPFDAGGACNTLVNDGPTVTLTTSRTSATTPTGGAVTPGRYHLTAAVAHGTGILPILIRLRQTFDIGAASSQLVTDVTGSPTTRGASSYTASGTSLTTTEICPNPGTMQTVGYSASPTRLVLVLPSTMAGFTEVEATFTLVR